MTEVATKASEMTGSGTALPKGLAARVLGVFLSPRDIYADLAARPRALGALVVVAVLTSLAVGGFLMTEVGITASLDRQFAMMESFGFRISDQQAQQMEARAAYAPYFAAGGILVSVPIMTALVAGLGMMIFTVGLGGDARFKQVFAIVAHAELVQVLRTLFVLPINYARESMSSATSLLVFLPMLDPDSFLGRLFGWIDLFRIWWIVSLAIGLGVLYKRKTGPIAISLMAVYVVFALVAAAIMAALSGAQSR